MGWTSVGVTLSLLIGLALTRLLTGLVSIFRARLRARPDWIPIAWAVILIVALLKSWAVLSILPSIKPTFSFLQYLGLGGLYMLLFAAASLLLPPGEIGTDDNLRTFFEEEGRYALPIFAIYVAAGAVLNIVVPGKWPNAFWFVFHICFILVPALFIFPLGRRAQAAITLLYVIVILFDIFVTTGFT